MSDPYYDVAVRLSLAQFDDRRAALATVRRVVSEARALRRLDPHLARVRARRCGRSSVELTVRVAAPSSWAAFDRGRAVVRASIHAVGGDTVGWERLTPEVRPPGRRGAPRAPRPPVPAAPVPSQSSGRASSGWAAQTARAQRMAAQGPSLPSWGGRAERSASSRPLPPLPGSPVTRSPLGEMLIDLR